MGPVNFKKQCVVIMENLYISEQKLLFFLI